LVPLPGVQALCELYRYSEEVQGEIGLQFDTDIVTEVQPIPRKSERCSVTEFRRIMYFEPILLLQVFGYYGEQGGE
jgi:hypothetical protein